ncbi:hypothetical protein Micr_00446 [Candidatus Micrarchaeum sp.]|jgi:hypothetical protein|uniref:LamG domain-containing protein n=1 Tax=Candidatus Micrarchaeum sp. TaxID=2282148 RepID=UPI000AF4339D|nr:LamG domain-containing protein [Candidatus Micrarchaeum sp.]OWP53325.1 MAG: hypothetical protein B2I19_02570 [Thermoplasmatales archaeon ARMAN]QRF73918.1 hypothetical protein Micr_00446 [Candidatus Micrarchaeum sp.]
MALKKKIPRKPKSKRGILLTLLTLVIFILMLGEVITYVVLNINYDNLSSSVAQSLASGNFAQNLDSGMNAFLYSSMSKSIGIMIAFESDPATRMGNFITNSSDVLYGLLYNGTIFNSTAYYNNSFKKAVSEFEAEALTDGFTANLSNVTLRVKQAAPFRIGVYVTGLAALNTSSGISLDYPINANTTVSLNSKPSLIGAEQGLNGTFQKEVLPKATIIGNLTAESGSESPYMFAYGKIIYMAGEPSCSNVPSEYTNGNYILATPNAADIGQNVCGMAGLITNISNSSTPLKPYLVYKNDTIMSYLQDEPNFLINGAGLDLLNTSAIQSSAVGGFYYASPYTASYLQRTEGKPYAKSPEGIFSFRSIDRNAANFNGNSEITTSIPIASTYNFTVAFWVNPKSLSKMESGNGYTILNSQGTNNFEMWLNNGGSNAAAPGSGNEEIGFGSNFYHGYGITNSTWNFVAVSVSNGIATFYDNNMPAYKVSIVGGPYSIQDLAIGQSAQGISQLNGSIANVQVYNSTLSSLQLHGIYLQGINAMSVNESGLVAWYPLSSNANDYSGNGYNGVPTNVIYSGVNGYTLEPTGQLQQNYVSSAATINATGGIYAAKVPFSKLGFNYSVSMWFELKSAIDPTDNSWSPIIDLYNATTNGGVGGGQAYDFGGAWAGGSSSQFGWGEYWPQNWQFCDTPAGLIKPDVKYNAVVTVHNYTNITVYINGNKENNCVITTTLSTVIDNSQNLALGIGDNPPGGDEIANATISNVQLYASTLNYSQAKWIYLNGSTAGPSQNENSAIGWWQLDGNANNYLGPSGNGTITGAIFDPQELPASTSPLEGVLGCDSMSSCNATAQRLYLSGLPLEDAGLGYMNASTSLGMQDGLVPAATSFNGNGYEYAPIGSYFGTDNSLTAEAWVYATPSTNGPIIAVRGTGGSAPLLSENGLKVHGWVNGVNSNIPLNYTLRGSGWYNLIITYNSTSASEVFYVNGTKVNSSTGTYAPSSGADYWTTYTTGSKPAGVDNAFSGTIADVQLYKSAMSPSMAEQLYLNNSVEGIGPADYWPLSSGNLNMLNETENVANYTNYAYLYDSPSVACTNSQVVNGNCGVEYVPG